jgi:glycosyltransferase involved in cell wall biosynthesis
VRIGVVSALLPPDPGGLGQTVWAKHRWLAARGVPARIVTFAPRAPSPDHLGAGAPFGPEIVRYDPLVRAGGSLVEKLRDVRAMSRILGDALADCDLIEVQGWTLWNTALVLRPGPLRDKPWIHVYRGTDGWEWRPWPLLDLRRRMNLRATTLANGHGLAAHLRERGLRIDGVIWSEVDPALFDCTFGAGSTTEVGSRAHGARDLRAPPAEPEPGLIVSVKGLYPVGDPATLLRALGIVARRGLPFRLAHVGEGPLLDAMKDLSRELGIADRVEFLGGLPHAEVPAVLARASLGVLSSRLESCPHVVGEAMMMARPVVATATTGAAELIRDGETGWLARIGDPEDLAEKIARVLEDPEGARAMGLRARDWARANLHVDVVFEKYLDLYRRLTVPRRNI